MQFDNTRSDGLPNLDLSFDIASDYHFIYEDKLLKIEFYYYASRLKIDFLLNKSKRIGDPDQFYALKYSVQRAFFLRKLKMIIIF